MKWTYTLHTSVGELDLEANDVGELRSMLEQRLREGDFDAEATERRWLPVSRKHNGYLVGRVDRHGRGEPFVGFDARRPPPETPPYRLCTPDGGLRTPAWTAHEFRAVLARLDARDLHTGPVGPRAITVMQGQLRVGRVDPDAKTFQPNDQHEAVAYWLGEGRARVPLDARNLDDLRKELLQLWREGGLGDPSTNGEQLAVVNRDRVCGHVAVRTGLYQEAPPTLTYRVHRSSRHWYDHQPRTDDRIEELRRELARLFEDGEFQAQ